MKGALGDMMKKAQEMQENMQKAQAELANKEKPVAAWFR
jgi:DNA-binding protein YbaB